MAEINGQMIRIFTAVNFLCFLPVFIRCCLNVKKTVKLSVSIKRCLIEIQTAFE